VPLRPLKGEIRQIMDYDYREKKSVLILNAKLKVGVALTVAAHLGTSMGFHGEEHMGREWLSDKSGVRHRGLPRYPLMVFKAKVAQLREALNKARETPELLVIDCPSILLDTAGDDELATALEEMNEQDIDYMGILIHGSRDVVDSITGKLRPWW